MTLTDQEAFWKGKFGNDYTDRNRSRHWIASNVAFFSRALSRTRDIDTVLELGANLGLNLAALKVLLHKARFSAVEINEKAAAELQHHLPDVDLHVISILGFKAAKTWDLVFTKGVLINIDPNSLNTVYELMHRVASRYILVSEYYNPTPTDVVYRGHTGKLFKRDFAGEMLDMFRDLVLVDYGFTYHRDPNFPQDDMTWFLMKKE